MGQNENITNTTDSSRVHLLVIVGWGPAYFGPQRGDRLKVQCACPGERRGIG